MLPRIGYLDNPLPSLFKERLFVWLSRFCEVRYCIARHVGFLLGMRHAAGAARCPPMSVTDVLRLLRREVPHDADVRRHAARLAALEQVLDQLPAADSELEWPMFCCATHIFLHGSAEPDCLGALRHALGPARCEQLMLLLAFTRMAHYWTQVHPELTLDEIVDAAARLMRSTSSSMQILQDNRGGPVLRLLASRGLPTSSTTQSRTAGR